MQLSPAGKTFNSKQSLIKYIVTNKWLYIFVAPAFILVLIFNYLPIPGIIVAFQDYDPMKGFLHSSFVGLDNFKDVFSDTDLPRILKNTLGISTLGLIIGFPMPMILAILINEMSFIKLKRFIQTASYLPHFISWVVVAGIMYDLLNADYGVVNKVIGLFGIQGISFLSEPSLFWGTAISISIWKEIGWASIIYLAAIVSIDQEQYEAAIVDGASLFKRIIYITIPGIMPTVAVLLILQAGALLTGASGLSVGSPGFDGIYNLHNAGNGDTSEVLDLWIYNEGVRRQSFSFAGTVGLLLAVFNMTFVYIANKIANKINGSGIF